MIHRLRALVLVRHALERYADFGPALLTEELAKEGVKVDHDTVRRWLLAGGETDRALAEATAPAMAGAQAVFRGDGATERFAPRLVGRAAGGMRAEGDGG